MVRETSEHAADVSDETRDIAAAVEEQTAMVKDIDDAVNSLTD